MNLLNRPIDGGLKLGGRRLFGENKNWRGPVFYVVFGTAFAALIHFTIAGQLWVSSAYDLDPLKVGLATTSAYASAELLNSFVKRRLGIEPGQSPKSRVGAFIQAFFDNLDGALASGLVLYFCFGAPPLELLLALGMSFLIHASTDVWMRALGLKKTLKKK